MIQCVPEEETSNSEFITKTLFPRLKDVVLLHRPARSLKSFTLHWDNSRPHISYQTRSEVEESFRSSLKHPPYSPYFSPSDFFLFCYLESLLIEKIIKKEHDLIEQITNSFKTITKDMKKSEFEKWKRKLQLVMENG